MKKTGAKKHGYASRAGIFLLLLCVLCAVFLVSCDFGNPPDTGTDESGAGTTAPETEPEEYGVTVSYDGAVIMDYAALTASPFEAEQGKKLVYKRTGSGPDLRSLRIDYADGQSQSGIITGNTCEIPLNAGGSAVLSFEAEADGKTVFFVSSAEYFREIASSEAGRDCTLRQLADICTDSDVTVTVPFTWSTGGFYFSCAGLEFRAQGEGLMTINNVTSSDIACASLLCLTPDWSYQIEHSFSDFSEQVFRRIDAKSVNGRETDRTSVCIGCNDDFVRFTSGEFRSYLDAASSVEFSGNMELSPFTLKNAESVVFSGEIIIPGGAEIFSTKNSLSIDTSSCSEPIAGSLSVFAPDASLSWTGAGAPDFTFAEQYYTVKDYNGKALDKYLGGSGSAKITSLIASGVSAEIAGRYVTVYTPYSSALGFADAVFDVSIEGGTSYKITASAEGVHYITVYDASGGKYCYRLSIEHALNNLPVINLTTDSGLDVTSKTKYVPGTFSLDYNGSEGMTDEDNISAAAITVRGRGHASWELAKKPYLVKFAEKTSLFGLEKAKDWVLQANHADYSLIRNKLASDISQKLTNIPFTPHSFPVDVFLNGRYVGVYTLTERVEPGKGRVEIEEDSTEVDTDYLLELQGELSATSWGGINVFTTNLCFYTEIKNPAPEVLTKEQFDYIVSYVNKVDKAVAAKKDYEKYIDIDSLIDWFILTELSYNTDGAMRRSVFFVKTKGEEGKIVFTAPWDFDYGFGNIYFTSAYEEWICLGSNASLDKYPATHNGNKYIRTNWMNYLLSDPAFKAKLKERWNEVKEDVYKAAMDSIDASYAALAPSAAENFTVWKNVLGKRIQYQASEVYKLRSWDEQVEYLKTFIGHRYGWMDKEINSY